MADTNPFRLARDRANMNQGAVALALGVAQSAVSKWERGRAFPEAKTLVELAALYRCAVDELVVGISPAYDRQRRDLLRQRGEGTSAPHHEGRADVAHARIQQLQAELDGYKARLREVQGITRQLFRIATGRKGTKASRRSS